MVRKENGKWIIHFEGWTTYALIVALMAGGFYTGYKTAKVPTQCVSISQ